MKFIINKKNSADSITLELEPTATVNELLFTLYNHRSKCYESLSFSEYQKLISVYQYFLYGHEFKKKWLPGTNLADYQPEDPSYLIWEEFTGSQCFLTYHNASSSRVSLWQTNTKSNEPEIENDTPAQSRKLGG